MKIAHKIQQLRSIRGYSQEYMAKKLGMVQQNYSDIENGKHKMDDELLTKILQILEISYSSFHDFSSDLVFNNHNQFSITTITKTGNLMLPKLSTTNQTANSSIIWKKKLFT